MRFAALALCAVVLAGCAKQPSAQAHASPSHPILTAPPQTPDPTAAPDPTHVFVIVLENRSYSQVIGNGYVAQLAAQYGVASNYHGVSHPSLPNYLALTSGSTWGVADDGWHSLPAGGLGAQLTNAGIEWRAYMEGMSNGCYHSAYPYALKHNPFAYYGGACPSQVVPFTNFTADLSTSSPRFVWITPDMCHDGHDCSTATTDAWLSQTVPAILQSDAWQDNGVLFITWDEGEDSGNSVLTLVIHPDPVNHVSKAPYDHYSLLATIEDQLGVPRLGAAARATAMADLMATKPQPPLRNRA
jgi:phosphatidylinositol-3-phosphatase